MTQHQWGRSSEVGRQRSRWPVYTTLLLPLALAAGIATAVTRYHTATTLQRWYLPAYAMSSYGPRLAARFHIDASTRVGSALTSGHYQLVDLVDDRYVAQPKNTYAHEKLEPWLRETVYDGQSAVAFVAWWPLVAAAAVIIFGLCLTIPVDARRWRRLREGEVLRGGPRLRTAGEFNRAHRKNNGMRIRVER